LSKLKTTRLKCDQNYISGLFILYIVYLNNLIISAERRRT